MDSPVSSSTSKRALMMDSLMSPWARIPKEELKKKITMPRYLRLAIHDAIQAKDVDAGKSHYDGECGANSDPADSPESPLVVFINSRSGGRQGPEVKERLQELMSEEQVFDLSIVKPHEFVKYGLGCLENFASFGDYCAKETRERLRVVVAGGDGTVGWVLGCLGELNKQGRGPVPPTSIIPLGTGNDLSRSFGWGGSLPFNWKSAVKRTLFRSTIGLIGLLDRGLNNILRMHVKRVNCSDWEQISLPSSVRALVALNLQNYASGRNPWGNLKPDYMEKKGFVEANVDDGLLEIFGLKQGWHASFVMGELIQAKHIAQASEIRFEFRGGQWKECFLQMDGEPWKQPMNMDYSTFVEIKKVPFQSVMINGE